MSSNNERSKFARWITGDDIPTSTYTSDAASTFHVQPQRQLSELDVRRSLDVLNNRSIDLENRLNHALKVIDRLNTKNVEQDEMIEYLKDIANKEI